MDFQELKKKNLPNIENQTEPKEIEVEEIPKDSDLVGINQKLEHLLAEQITLSNRMLKVMEQSEKDKKVLTKRLQESEMMKVEQTQSVNKVLSALRTEVEEVKNLNYQKIEELTKKLNEESRENQDYHNKMTKDILELVYQVKNIPNPSWKERAKQYSIQLGTTVGLIVGIVGAYQLVILLVKLLKH